MKLVIRTGIFHIFCILLFSYIYLYLADDFILNEPYVKTNRKPNLFDCLLLGTTIQAGVGVSVLIPTTNYLKFLMIIQQLIMIMTHIITIYIFTI
jgi:hypothetical protein